MSGLFGTLTLASRSLAAQQFGLEMVGQNISNVNTDGYSRRVVDFAAVPPTDRLDPGGGVEVSGVRSIRDNLLERRLWQEIPEQQKNSAMADSLQVVEVALGDAGQSLDDKLTQFFDSFSALAEDPTSSTARQQVLLQGQAIGSAFGDMVGRLNLAQRDADSRVRGVVDQINSLATKISTLNVSIAKAGGSGADIQTLKDQQNEAVKTLSGLMKVDVLERQDGGVDITFGLGRPLIIGDTPFALSAAPTGPLGLSTITSNGVDVASEIKSGTLGGLLQVRDTTIPGYISRLDDIAYTLNQQVNTLHSSGFDLNGAAGLPFFTPLGAAAGAASALTVDAAVAADPSKIAAAAVNTAGDNQVARQLANLRDSRVMFGGTATLHDAWGRLVYQAGTDSQVAQAETSNREEIVRQVQALRDSVSGVSLDEEAANMIKFQRAYEANARFFNTVNSALDVLLSLGQ
jgi:flagellar hook-associated protein 1 FlgK